MTNKKKRFDRKLSFPIDFDLINLSDYQITEIEEEIRQKAIELGLDYNDADNFEFYWELTAEIRWNLKIEAKEKIKFT